MSRVARLGWLLPTMANPLSQSTAGRRACWCRTCTSGRVPSGSGDCSSLPTTSPASGSPWATTTTGTPGASSATGETRAVAVQPRRTLWRLAEVIEVVAETPRTKSLLLEVPGWEGHKAGQHVDVRLTAEDGYQAQRSYSIASAPEDGRVELLVERLDDGEVSPYLTDELRAGDGLELRGPIGGWFAWEAREGGPLLLVAGGSGIAPLMAMIRHRQARLRPLRRNRRGRRPDGLRERDRYRRALLHVRQRPDPRGPPGRRTATLLAGSQGPRVPAARIEHFSTPASPSLLSISACHRWSGGSV